MKKELIIKCEDNCSCLSIDKWEEDDIYYITFYNSYTNCSFLKKIKDIWKIIRGKQIHNSEVVLSKEKFDKIRNFK